MSFRLLKRAAPVALVLALSACGFHLRNQLVLPPDMGPVRVVSVDRFSPLAESLAQALTRAGAVPATERTPDATVLDLLSERWGDRPIALDELGRAQEFSLRYAVTFELRRADGTTPVPRQTIELARDYVSNPVQAIGTEGEREILQTEMRREMVASILRRLDAVARHTFNAAEASPAGAQPDAPRAADAVEVPKAEDAPTATPTPTPTPTP
ncbi:LPS assembly lipoprotein LptE [Lysobacter sp. LF1]|uniref:LPS-assembly lipoprotein LptE n=1 Tax=Lysobacter stagni TaxID=3045172 RepID=A0ABT6XHN0_9GAMM|nr:LPS assembly lipoprotein LptE [Lysobacter sp. LF1]MDI9239285.1 LPS assembly lipoprotein LptE [Lysobacter sp. LF1]